MKPYYWEIDNLEKNPYSIKLDYGLRDGNVIDIDIDTIKESERGLKCNCICPACNTLFRQSLDMNRAAGTYLMSRY